MAHTRKMERFHCEECFNDKFIKTKFNELEQGYYTPEHGYFQYHKPKGNRPILYYKKKTSSSSELLDMQMQKYNYFDRILKFKPVLQSRNTREDRIRIPRFPRNRVNFQLPEKNIISYENLNSNIRNRLPNNCNYEHNFEESSTCTSTTRLNRLFHPFSFVRRQRLNKSAKIVLDKFYELDFNENSHITSSSQKTILKTSDTNVSRSLYTRNIRKNFDNVDNNENCYNSKTKSNQFTCPPNSNNSTKETYFSSKDKYCMGDKTGLYPEYYNILRTNKKYQKYSENIVYYERISKSLSKSSSSSSKLRSQNPILKNASTQTSPLGNLENIIINISNKDNSDDIFINICMKDEDKIGVAGKENSLILRCENKETINVKKCIRMFEEQSQKLKLKDQLPKNGGIKQILQNKPVRTSSEISSCNVLF